MIQLYVSKDLAKPLKQFLTEPEAAQPEAMQWYGHLVSIQQQHYMLLMEADSSYCMLFPQMTEDELAMFPQLFVEQLYRDALILCEAEPDSDASFNLMALIAEMAGNMTCQPGLESSAQAALHQTAAELEQIIAEQGAAGSEQGWFEYNLRLNLLSLESSLDSEDALPVEKFAASWQRKLAAMEGVEANPELQQLRNELNQLMSDGQPTPAATEAEVVPLLSIYQLKINLENMRPPVWRRVLVHSNITLDTLHHVIQAAMGWDNCHLHHFIDGHEIYAPQELFDAHFPKHDSSEVRLFELLVEEKDKLEYEYDFGDGWVHKIVLEKVLPYEKGAPLAQCIKGKRACPPEDCGGFTGYYNLLEILNDSQHEDYQETLEWLGGPFNPEACDLDEINRRLQEID